MEPARLQSHIEAVTVYRTGALVQRVAPLGRPEGRRVIVPGLPLSLEDGSVRIGLRGAGSGCNARDVRIVLDVGSIDTTLPPPTPETLREARRQEARAAQHLALLQESYARVEALEAERRPQPEPGKPPPPYSVIGRLTLLAWRAAQLERLRTAVETAREEYRQAEQQLRALAAEDERASQARQTREHELRKAAVIELTGAPLSEAGELTLAYLVPGARWAPSYALSLDAGLREASLAMRAAVCQQTGEDWTGVRLRLSTAAAQGWAELPELTSVRIGRAQAAPVRRGFRAAPEGAASLYEDYDRAFGPPRDEAFADEEDDDDFDAATGGLVGIQPETEWQDEGSSELEEEADLYAGEKLRKLKEMPPPAAAPMEMLSAPPPPPAPMPAGAAPPMMAKRATSMRRRVKTASFGGANVAPQAAMAPPSPPAAEPSPLLSYGRLRMPGAGDIDRGSLRAAARRQLYLEIIAEQHIELRFDAIEILHQARAQAAAVLHQPCPRLHIFPEAEGFDYAYAASHPVDLPADGSFHTLAIQSGAASAAPRYVCVPRETQDVFRIVEMDNPWAAPLLAGPIDVSVAGAYLLTASLRETPPNGRLELGLGVEQRIKASRNTHFDEASTGVIRGRLELAHGIEIELINHTEHTADVEVRERIPVARERDEDVEVRVTEVDPEWNEWLQEEQPVRGAYHWRAEVPAGGKQLLRAAYTVRIPPKHELVGGNRREA